mmetsp:Transcript_11333/g.32158  ORF Transcript_11333/g.32158 Transcript_11333/m.32158 type:complete len:274 (-) Transcript_11333:795-1616(-)
MAVRWMVPLPLQGCQEDVKAEIIPNAAPQVHHRVFLVTLVVHGHNSLPTQVLHMLYGASLCLVDAVQLCPDFLFHCSGRLLGGLEACQHEPVQVATHPAEAAAAALGTGGLAGIDCSLGFQLLKGHFHALDPVGGLDEAAHANNSVGAHNLPVVAEEVCNLLVVCGILGKAPDPKAVVRKADDALIDSLCGCDVLVPQEEQKQKEGHLAEGHQQQSHRRVDAEPLHVKLQLAAAAMGCLRIAEREVTEARPFIDVAGSQCIIGGGEGVQGCWG